jgi:hypothetical protein
MWLRRTLGRLLCCCRVCVLLRLLLLASQHTGGLCAPLWQVLHT